MKKALSLILALIMVFALATTAFATTDHVVGNRGGEGATGDYRDGVDTFTDEDAEHIVKVTVSTAQVVEKYAVDVEYDTNAIQLGGSKMVWNVNTLQYELVASDNNKTETLEKKITIFNYSSLPVYAYASIAHTNDDGLDVTTDHDVDNVLPIEDAKGGVKKAVITISLTPATDKTWGNVVDWYTKNVGASDTITVATATIHILKDDPNP